MAGKKKSTKFVNQYSDTVGYPMGTMPVVPMGKVKPTTPTPQNSLAGSGPSLSFWGDQPYAGMFNQD
jgi:hypothetical protein